MANFRTMKTNLVQAIRAHSVSELQNAATEAGHHFLKNFDALYDCLTDPIHKAGAQNGFVVVLEHIPCNPRFDKEVREQLMDIFRDVSDYWSDRKTPFRCFYSFSVARANDGSAPVVADGEAGQEKLPTDKLIDISPLALRMSSPFNAGYWLAAAQEEEPQAAA